MGGSEFCIHNKRKDYCKECGGKQICIHNREKTKCKDCGGSQICIHNRMKNLCKDCNGKSICIHNNRRIYCRECGGSQFCIHSKQKRTCKECSPNSNIFCHSCHLIMVTLNTNYLCSNCNPTTKQSHGELIIQNILQQYKINFIKQYKHPNQNDTKISLCKYDFYLPIQTNINKETIIEFHGEQHYKFTKFFHKTNDRYLKRWYYDILKKEFCLKNNINFIEIKYNDNIFNKLQIENII